MPQTKKGKGEEWREKEDYTTPSRPLSYNCLVNLSFIP